MGAMGRPKSDNPLTRSLKIRFDEDTGRKLDEYSKKHRMKKTEVVRQGLKMILETNPK